MTSPRDDVASRRAQPGDGAAIAAVRAVTRRLAYRSFLPAGDLDDPAVEASDAASYETGLSRPRPDARVDVAESGGEIVGYCSYGASEPRDFPSGGWIYDLFVHPRMWRLGVGGALLRRALDFLVEMGCTDARLFVFEPNERARAFYEALGWEADGHRELSDAGAPALRYRVRLP